MSRLMLVGEAWGRHEEKIQRPFVGASGIELIRMLHEAGICDADEDAFAQFYKTGNPAYVDEAWPKHIYRTNVFNLHPKADRIESICGPKEYGIPGLPPLAKSKYVFSRFAHHINRLADEVEKVAPNLVICLGNTPLWAFTGRSGISKLRGTTRESTSICRGLKLLPTYHPAAVVRQWELRPVVIADFMKASREMEFPEIRRPEREIWIEPTLEDLETFYETHITSCEILSVDIETSGNQVTCIGFAPGPGVALVVPLHDARRKGGSYWPDADSERQAIQFIRRVCEDPSIKKVFQNGMYDITFLVRSLGIKTYGAEHDTMLCHHALQPEALKRLDFLGSIYTDEGAWKTERKTTTIKRDE